MIINLIRTKRAVRQFSDEAVPDEIINEILEAGRLAQSSQNDQPWDFIVVRERERLRELSTCGKYAGHVAGANFAIALIVQPTYDFDLGQAAAYMQLAAWDRGVASCLASMWEAGRAKSILRVPQDKQFDTVISFGYPLKKPVAAAAVKRRALGDVVHWETWESEKKGM